MGLFVILAASVQLMSCGGGGGSSGDSNNGGMISSGSWYVTGFAWPHDGNPWESENFVIYSDSAGEDAKLALAQLAEETLSDLKILFAIDTNDIFLYPPGQKKIDIFAYKNHFPRDWGGWAYYGGLLIFSPDHPERTNIGHTEPEIYNPTLKHELMHVVESLLKVSNNPTLVDVWLTEGIAEAVSGGTAGGSITDLQKFQEPVIGCKKRSAISHRVSKQGRDELVGIREPVFRSDERLSSMILLSEGWLAPYV
jgi:hypothetical protein